MLPLDSEQNRTSPTQVNDVINLKFFKIDAEITNLNSLSSYKRPQKTNTHKRASDEVVSNRCSGEQPAARGLHPSQTTSWKNTR